jgi:hypothetical protein
LGETQYIKWNAFLLLAIIPLSIVGYYFAVYNESLFFLYEWLLTLLIIISIIFSIISIIKIKSGLKWVSMSILAFLIQFSVLGLFLGPITHFRMFYLYYFVALIAVVVFIVAIRKVNKLKFLPIIFTVLSVIFTLYMILLNNLWGNDLS